MFFEDMHPSWQSAIAGQRSLLNELEAVVLERIESGEPLAPPIQDVMRAFRTDLSDVRVLIVGQDPYPTLGHAIGLSFAVSEVVKPLPRSLQNIMKELAVDLPEVSHSGRIELWQDRGVLLLNRHLTTPIGQAAGHSKLGWNAFTDAVVDALVSRKQILVAILWGNHAAELEPKLTGATVLKSAHPSPLSASRGFFGSRPFSRVNQALREAGLGEIDWSC